MTVELDFTGTTHGWESVHLKVGATRIQPEAVDEEGAVRLLVRKGSGFEGRTDLYYIRYWATFEPL